MNVQYLSKPTHKEVKFLGSGSYGKVHLDEQKRAIKLFRRNNISSYCGTCEQMRRSKCVKCGEYERVQLSEFDTSFFKELSLLMNMSHCPHVPQVSEIYFGSNAGYAMTKYDCSLHDLMKNSIQWQLTHPVIQYIITQLVITLAYAQQLSILHRDVKPHNIMLNTDCKTFLIDWGLSTCIYNEHLQLDEKEVQTLWYRAPEHLLCEITEYNNVTIDMWSVGIIMMEMLRQQMGFIAGDKSHLVMAKIVYYFGFPTENSKMMSKMERYKNVQQRTTNIFESCKEYGLSEIGIDLLRKMLDLNPVTRITPFDALNHPYITEYINERIPEYVPIIPTINLNKLGSYYPTNVSSDYLEIRHFYVTAYKLICEKFERFDITELALMLMYTDALSKNELFKMSENIEEIVITVSQMVGTLLLDESYDLKHYVNIFRLVKFNHDKCFPSSFKTKIHILTGEIIRYLKFPLASCSYVTLGYYIKNISITLYQFYMILCAHVVPNYDLYKYSNEVICYSILTKMTTYSCNNNIVLGELGTICERVNINVNFSDLTTFEILNSPEIQTIHINDVGFSLP